MDETTVWTKDEQISTIYGQSSSSSTTPGHKTTMENIAGREASSGEYDYLTMQRSLRTTTGRAINSRTVPDVTGVRKDGIVDIWEVASQSDDEEELLARGKAALSTLPVQYRGKVTVVDPLTGGIITSG